MSKRHKRKRQAPPKPDSTPNPFAPSPLLRRAVHIRPRAIMRTRHDKLVMFIDQLTPAVAVVRANYSYVALPFADLTVDENATARVRSVK